MGALSSLASLAGAGVGLYAQAQAQRQSAATQRAQAEIQQKQQSAQMERMALQQGADRRARQEQLARTVAAARARLGGSGVSVDDGSAAAVDAGLGADAAAGLQDSDALFRARLASGRASLLNPDLTLTTALRALPSFGNAVRSLLD